ncbi:MAG: hypothetical protein LBK60_12670 [Verrucomicrobiales bacterium]|jgi:hypothetical protein|nr:hypothetical protein [Verrucomicrobiales bacterium]
MNKSPIANKSYLRRCRERITHDKLHGELNATQFAMLRMILLYGRTPSFEVTGTENALPIAAPHNAAKQRKKIDPRDSYKSPQLPYCVRR